MEEVGKVVKKEDGIVVIQIPISEHCSRCAMSKVCFASESDFRNIRARNLIDAKIGDTVKLNIPTHKRVFLSFVVFGLPIFTGIIGILIGQGSGNLGTAIGALTGLGIGLAIVKLVDLFWGKKQLPRVIEVCKEQ
ncbi:hypothetical protein BXT86_00505 [candidate division WOR-3 bacterium 4484_100]|uniref:Fis family transcriptional regulator n=1 Tax=candidate division WOR-3 bacterium 4484_100 TaxID=1936077 RepID=A0A1V4QGU9_UNCW3|nr:MAG: hypothetical protein BXT86_00505 [candidate division WOR-3 bacterium 4484_100]